VGSPVYRIIPTRLSSHRLFERNGVAGYFRPVENTNISYCAEESRSSSWFARSGVMASYNNILCELHSVL
jgi:hypothetical protein